MSETHVFSGLRLRTVRVLALIILFATIAVPGAGAQSAAGDPGDGSSLPSDTPTGDNAAGAFEDDFFEDEFGFDDQPEGTRPPGVVADPLKPLNRAFFVFNDKFYFWIVKPVTLGYRWVLPAPVRTGVSNFFVNLFTPIRFTNCLLQGKLDGAATEYARFVTNTTIGVLGFGNPAKNLYSLEKQEEDFGQTLAVWGVGNGFFLTLPFLGPSTLRDGLAVIPDWYLSPITYLTDSTAVTLGTYFFRTVNETSFRIGDYEAIKEAALDPYEAVRDGYIQFRRSKVEE